MKKFALVFAVLFVSACGVVHSDTPLAFAQRAHPECKNFDVVSHRLQENSLTEVSMQCNEVQRSITVKCQFGWGLIADTVCYENN